MSDTAQTGPNKTVYFLKCLIELIENDQIHRSKIEGMTAGEVISLAETEAAKAVEGANELKDRE